jgi:aminomethyltransferase
VGKELATSATLLRTPLYEVHLAMAGRMVEFAGWEMPIQYTGIIDEHAHTRAACSVFDVSHMGRLSITGKAAGVVLDRLCTRRLTEAEVGRSYYSHICREDGGILDDVIVSRFEDRWGVVCNASNRDKIVNWINRHAAGHDVQLRDLTLSTCMVACQGPRTIELSKEFTEDDLSTLKRYRFRLRSVGPLQVVIYRSGYTGEDGLEIVVPASLVNFLAPKLFGTREQPHPVIKPAGLGARDTLRMEAGMPLYGHELTEEWDSLTAGQEWCVDLTKDFIGVEPMRRLKEGGLPRKLVGLELDGRRIARQHFAVFGGGQVVGAVTSGTLSPTLGKSIAMAIVDMEHTKTGSQLEVEVAGGKRTGAKVVPLPFYQRAK